MNFGCQADVFQFPYHRQYFFVVRHFKMTLRLTIYISTIFIALYRMGITTNLEEILEDFEVFGLSDETWSEFEKGKEYEAFLVKRKLY